MENNIQFADKYIKKISLSILFLLLFFIIMMLVIIFTNRKLPPLLKESKQRAVRGSIISSDGYTISRSIKKYSISIHTKYLNPNKKDFFLTLLVSILIFQKRNLKKSFLQKMV